MSAPGSKARQLRPAGVPGFTLLELLLVVAIIAMASAGVGFALRDVGQTPLEREGLRLAAMLESARARSRAAGVPVVWRANASGFEFIGLPLARTTGSESPSSAGPLPMALAPSMPWLTEGLSVPAGTVVTLGPEPVIDRQRIELSLGAQRVHVATDGLRAFVLLPRGDTGALP